LVTFTEEAFGAKLLEAITAGLYDGNLNLDLETFS